MLGETQKAWLNTQHILDRGIKDVVAMTGDIHTFFAGQITSTGRVDGTPAAVEFVGGSITSLGVEETFQDAPGIENLENLISANDSTSATPTSTPAATV